MKFSTLTIFDNYPNQLPRTPGQFYNEVLEQGVRAEEMNFDGVCKEAPKRTIFFISMD